MDKRRKKVCKFCADSTLDVDYKDIKTIQKYINSYGKIDARKRTGLCPKHQRKISVAIKRARIMALISFVGK